MSESQREPPKSTTEVLLRACPMLNVSLPPWHIAMSACFHFEVMVRILAQKHFLGESVRRDIGDGKKGKGLLTMLFGKLAFTAEQQRFLRLCNTLRNKLIHCEPDGVLKVLQKIDPAIKPPGTAFMIDLSGPRPGEPSTKPRPVRVQDTSSRKEGFAGWMLEAATDRTFELAAQAFMQAVLVVDSKAEQDPEPDQDPAR